MLVINFKCFIFSGIGHSASESMNTVEQVGGEKESYFDKDRYSSQASSGFFDS